MADREIKVGRDLLQRRFSAEVGFEPFADSLRLPRPSTTIPRVHHEVAAFGGIGQAGCGGQYLRAASRADRATPESRASIRLDENSRRAAPEIDARLIERRARAQASPCQRAPTFP
jgi:hypothetical protein